MLVIIVAVSTGCGADATLRAPAVVDRNSPSDQPERQESDAAGSQNAGRGSEGQPTQQATPENEDPQAEEANDAGLNLPIKPAPVAALVTPNDVPVAVVGLVGEDDLLVTTPCGRVATIPFEGETVDSVDIVLDPGHGGPIDTGTVGANGLVERDLNLAVSQATADYLIARGYTVLLTRTADYGATLATRAALADALDARVLVSVHHNAPTPAASAVPGPEVFVQTDSAESERLGGVIFERLRERLAVFDVAWSAADDAGVLVVQNTDGNDAYGMIRRPVVPAVLAELAYLSNPAEAELLATDAYVAVAAAALADAIDTYLTDPTAPGTGYGNPPRIFNPQRAPGTNDCEDTL